MSKKGKTIERESRREKKRKRSGMSKEEGSGGGGEGAGVPEKNPREATALQGATGSH